MKNILFLFGLLAGSMVYASDGGYTSGSDSDSQSGRTRPVFLKGQKRSVPCRNLLLEKDSDDDSSDKSSVYPLRPADLDRGVEATQESVVLSSVDHVGLGSPLHPDVAALLVRSIAECESVHVRSRRRSVSPEVRMPSRNEDGWYEVEQEDAEMARVERHVDAVLPSALPLDSERPGTPVPPAVRKRMSSEGELSRASGLLVRRLDQSLHQRSNQAGAWNPFDLDGVAQQTDDEENEF